MIELTFKQQMKILGLLRRISHAMNVSSKKILRDYKITSSQLMTLMILANQEPIKISDMSKMLFLSKGTLTGVLDRLEEKGLIERRKVAHDRRVIHIVSTEKGKALVKRTPTPLSNFTRNLYQLPEAEQNKLIKALERITFYMEKKYPAKYPSM